MPRKLVLSGAFCYVKNNGDLGYIILMEAINSSMGKLSAHTSSQVEGTVVWNATQHAATADQVAQGVRDLPEELRKELTQALTFEELPNYDELYFRSLGILIILQDAGLQQGDWVMVGGAPFLMEELCRLLRINGYKPVFAFSKRESVEKQMPDGTVQKIAIFKHLGFVDPAVPQQ